MIQQLNDKTAVGILEAIARTRKPAEKAGWDHNLEQALMQQFSSEPESARPSEGELARQALLLLAEDPQMRTAIETMAANWDRQPQKFDGAASIGITVAVLIILQTHIKFERTSTGKWNLKIEKKPTSDALLKTLVQKLISYMK